MRLYSISPTLSMKHRTFKGLRGYAGKPTHPPLTDIVVAGYVLAMVFDVVAVIAGRDSGVSNDAFTAATWVIVAAAVVSLPTALTGFVDWKNSTQPGTQAWRTANWHMTVMVTVTLLVVLDIVLRLREYDEGFPSTGVWVLTVVIGLLTGFGAMYGGALVYEYGFNVETAGDHPAWHVSETDVVPGQKDAAAVQATGTPSGNVP